MHARKKEPNYPLRTRELLRIVNDKSRPCRERDEAKNELVLDMVHRFRGKLFDLTGGKIGIADRQTELENSAFAYLKLRATKVAEEIEVDQLPLAHVVAKWLRSWAVDKIRQADGNSLKRAKGKQKRPVSEIANAAGDDRSPPDQLICKETAAQIKAALFSAVAELDDIEHAVILSYYGLDDRPELTMREVADELNIPLSMANNALRRAKAKLRAWLKKFDSLHSMK